MSERSCTACLETFPLTSEFWPRNRRSRGGFLTQCKSCTNEKQATTRRIRSGPDPYQEKYRNDRRAHVDAAKSAGWTGSSTITFDADTVERVTADKGYYRFRLAHRDLALVLVAE